VLRELSVWEGVGKNFGGLGGKKIVKKIPNRVKLRQIAAKNRGSGRKSGLKIHGIFENIGLGNDMPLVAYGLSVAAESKVR
jgi:hypothetical protein